MSQWYITTDQRYFVRTDDTGEIFLSTVPTLYLIFTNRYISDNERHDDDQKYCRILSPRISIIKRILSSLWAWSVSTMNWSCNIANDHIYRMVKERYSNIWPNQTIVSDQSELTIFLCQPMNSLLLMKTTLPWYSSFQLLPSYIDDPW